VGIEGMDEDMDEVECDMKPGMKWQLELEEEEGE